MSINSKHSSSSSNQMQMRHILSFTVVKRNLPETRPDQTRRVPTSLPRRNRAATRVIFFLSQLSYDPIARPSLFLVLVFDRERGMLNGYDPRRVGALLDLQLRHGDQ